MLDRFGVAGAQSLLSTQINRQLAAEGIRSSRPEVTIAGVPFLTQVVGGVYRDVTIGLRDFSAATGDGRVFDVPQLTVRAYNIRAAPSMLWNRRQDIVVESVTGTGVVDYGRLATMLGQPGLSLSAAGGELLFAADLRFLGKPVRINGTASLTLGDGVIQARVTRVATDGLGADPQTRLFVDSYVRQLSLDLRAPSLPLNLTVRKLEPRADGLAVTAEAADVRLTGG